MTNEEKAASRLRENGMGAIAKMDTVYVMVQDQELEISRNEISFQADLYVSEQENPSENGTV